ncbi:MAG: 3-oxoacyl-ACP synthase III family protein [Flavobacteriales bacterium]|nr:3-oxoacyl-ACP synthase III family protein [Flavobacteriales bacterium]
MIQSIVTGSGSYIPKQKIGKPFFLDKVFYDEDGTKIDKPAEEVIQKFIDITEIEERRYLEPELMNSDMAKMAGEIAIEQSGIDREKLDYVIAAHNYSDIDAKHRQIDLMPSFSIRVKNKLNIKTNKCKAYDMIYGCPGWVEGLILADQLIKSGVAKKILVIGSDSLSRAVDPHDRNSMIFADGAGAVVLEAKETNEKIGILNHVSICDSNEEIEYIGNSESLNSEYVGSAVNVRMKGRKVYEYALKKVPAAMKRAIDNAGLDITDIKMVLLHQANAKMDKAIIQRLFRLYKQKEIPSDFEPMTVQFLGNTSVATVPTMFDLINKGELKGYSFESGDTVLLASVGAGMVINAIVYRFE